MEFIKNCYHRCYLWYQELDGEQKILYWAFILSALLHLVVMIADLSWLPFRSVHVDEMVVQAEFLPELGDAETPSIRANKKAEKVKVAKQTLPQLPKQFAVKENDDEKPLTEKVDDAKEKMASLKEDEKNDKTPKTKDAEAEKKKKRNVTELSKKEALERMLKEKARQKKDFDDDAASPLSETLQKRRDELAKHLAEYTIGSDNINHAYAGILKQWVSKFYSLPEIYALKGQKIRTVIQAMLSSDGSISSIKIIESSKMEVFDQLAMKTIQSAAPFPSPPNDWVGRWITFPFEIGESAQGGAAQ